MKKITLRLIALTFMSLLLSACFGPKTPSDVVENFWQAVLINDTRDIVEYSTLSDEKFYDKFSTQWDGYQVSFGKITIEKDKASVVTKLNSPANSGQNNRRFTTYLLLQNDVWKVDYDKTKSSILGGPLGGLFSKLNQIGNAISRELESSAASFKSEMERLGKELEQLSDSLNQQASENIEKYAAQLRNSIQELEESINRALKEKDNKLSDKDKRVLHEITVEIEQDSERLHKPSIKTITESSVHIGEAKIKLSSIENDSLDEYSKEWNTLIQQVENVMRKMIDELSSIASGKDVEE